MFTLTAPFTLTDGAIVPIKLMNPRNGLVCDARAILVTGQVGCHFPDWYISEIKLKHKRNEAGIERAYELESCLVVLDNGQDSMSRSIDPYIRLAVHDSRYVTLGMSFLKHFQATFDGPAQTVTLMHP